MELNNFRKLMAEAKFYESYARYIDEESRYETWYEAVERVMNMHREFYKDVMTDELKDKINFAERLYKEKRVLGAQRALQFGGDQLIKHQIRLFNCTSSHCNRPAFFGEFIYMLLCGAGAGFSVQYHHVNQLPPVVKRTKQAKTFVVPDSIEGWAKSFDVLLSSFFENGGKHPEYTGNKVYFDLHNIRPKGARISGGFKAPGPEPLRKALDKVEGILQSVASDNRQMKPIECYDICMHMADAVIAGGVRRSATIALFSPEDNDMMTAKTGNWFAENPQRGRSNNSAVLLRDQVTWEQFHGFMESIKQFGEPAFIFVNNREVTLNPLKLAA